MSSPQLGPFRLTAVTHRSQAGVVYSAVDSAGHQVSVVVLTRGAASDAAARDRFAAAIRQDAGSLVAADPDNSGPWAAGPEAARLLESVQLADAGRITGPRFQHHWAGWNDPAFPTYGAPAPMSGSDPYPTWDSARRSAEGGPGSFVIWGSAGKVTPASGMGERQNRPGGWIALILLVLLFLLVGLMLWWLFTSQPDPDKRPPARPTPTSQSPSPSPSGSPSSGSPTPSPSGSSPSSPTRTPGSTGPSGATPGQSGSGEPDDPL